MPRSIRGARRARSQTTRRCGSCASRARGCSSQRATASRSAPPRSTAAPAGRARAAASGSVRAGRATTTARHTGARDASTEAHRPQGRRPDRAGQHARVLRRGARGRRRHGRVRRAAEHPDRSGPRWPMTSPPPHGRAVTLGGPWPTSLRTREASTRRGPRPRATPRHRRAAALRLLERADLDHGGESLRSSAGRQRSPGLVGAQAAAPTPQPSRVPALSPPGTRTVLPGRGAPSRGASTQSCHTRRDPTRLARGQAGGRRALRGRRRRDAHRQARRDRRHRGHHERPAAVRYRVISHDERDTRR